MIVFSVLGVVQDFLNPTELFSVRKQMSLKC